MAGRESHLVRWTREHPAIFGVLIGIVAAVACFLFALLMDSAGDPTNHHHNIPVRVGLSIGVGIVVGLVRYAEARKRRRLHVELHPEGHQCTDEQAAELLGEPIAEAEDSVT